jgi:phospholipase/carboxylesterase
MLNFIEINPKNTPKSCIILLHGLGATGSDFVDIIPQLALSDELAVRFIFPTAPKRKIAWMGNIQTHAWFNVFGLGLNVPEDEAGMRESQGFIEEIIAHEIAQGIPSQKIVLAGFSQGGAMALHVGLRYQQQLAGILAMSCWLPLAKALVHERSASNQNIPILMQHGSLDKLLPLAWAQHSCDRLHQLGFKVQLDSYPMDHEVCDEEVKAIAKWLENLL